MLRWSLRGSQRELADLLIRLARLARSGKAKRSQKLLRMTLVDTRLRLETPGGGCVAGRSGRQKKTVVARSKLTTDAERDGSTKCNELSSASSIFCLLSECSRSCDWPAGAPHFRRECGINSPQSASTGPGHRESAAGGPAAAVPVLYVPASV